MRLHVHPLSFGDLPGWFEDDHVAAFAAFCQSAHHHLFEKPYKQKELLISPDEFSYICRVAMELAKSSQPSPQDARAFFEQNFKPVHISTGSEREKGFITAYYEPEILVSVKPDSRFRYPLYRRPDDLVTVENPDCPPGNVTNGHAFARINELGYSDYPDRRAIDQGLLTGKNLEIAYAANKADVYFTHIQGSARLVDKTGHIIRIAYAAKNGHPYNSIGKILIKKGIIHQDDISMASIRQWMKSCPDAVDEIIWQNRSYIFFDQLSDLDGHKGPVGAAKVQLSPQRSLAIDKLIYPFGLPIFVASSAFDRLNDKKQVSKLMIAQDTGSAIVGPNRGDIFVGSGEQAGELAGSIRHEACFYVLVPRS